MSDTKYNPASDSTPALQKKAAETGRVTLDWTDGTCLCGCKGEAAGRFQPGHDARMKGKLMRAHIAGVGLTIIEGKESVDASALQVAGILSSTKYDWKAAIEDGAKAAKTRAEAAAKKAAEVKAKREAAAKEKPSGKISLADLMPKEIAKATEAEAAKPIPAPKPQPQPAKATAKSA